VNIFSLELVAILS